MENLIKRPVHLEISVEAITLYGRTESDKMRMLESLKMDGVMKLRHGTTEACRACEHATPQWTQNIDHRTDQWSMRIKLQCHSSGGICKHDKERAMTADDIWSKPWTTATPGDIKNSGGLPTMFAKEPITNPCKEIPLGRPLIEPEPRTPQEIDQWGDWHIDDELEVQEVMDKNGQKVKIVMKKNAPWPPNVAQQDVPETQPDGGSW